METNTSARFSDAPWANKKLQIVIGGAGGIGSWVALSLSRIGHELYIYDFDTINDFNLGGQFYRHSQVNITKANALKDNLQIFSNSIVSTFSIYDESSLVTPIMIAAFDNMEARLLMFEKWLAQGDSAELFLDGRMMAESFIVYAVTPETAEMYRKEWFPSSEATQARCNYKATTFNAMGIAYVMTTLLNNFICIKTESDLTREVPFKWVSSANICSNRIEF